MTSLGEVGKAFPLRRSLCLHRLDKRASFICSRCSLETTSKLVAYAKDKWAEPLCNCCYGNLLSASKKQGVPRYEVISSIEEILAGILDWEAADYYSTFWTATKPPVSPGLDFYPPIAECDDFEWIKCLRMELERWRYSQA